MEKFGKIGYVYFNRDFEATDKHNSIFEGRSPTTIPKGTRASIISVDRTKEAATLASEGKTIPPLPFSSGFWITLTEKELAFLSKRKRYKKRLKITA